MVQQSAGARVIDSMPVFQATASFEVLDVLQQKAVHIDCSAKPLTMVVFLSPECPLCQNYTKVLNALKNQFGDHLQVQGIIPGDAYSGEDVTSFINKYKVNFSVAIDKEFKLSRYLQASVTPQAVLLDNNGKLVYKGAIDNWVTGLGKKRAVTSEHYAANAIQQYLAASPVTVKYTRSYGCKINDL